jgi:hypothetical protein
MDYNKICISHAFVQMILVHFIEFNKIRMHDVFLCRGIWSITLTLTQSVCIMYFTILCIAIWSISWTLTKFVCIMCFCANDFGTFY